jgi:hypothetical protein
VRPITRLPRSCVRRPPRESVQTRIEVARGEKLPGANR